MLCLGCLDSKCRVIYGKVKKVAIYIVFFFSIFVKNISIIILTNQQDVTNFDASPFLKKHKMMIRLLLKKAL